MPPTLKALPLLLLGVLLNAFAQVAMKKGLLASGGMVWSAGPLLRLAFQPWTIACFACYGISVVVWFAALNLVEVNFGYPFLALGFLINALMCRAFLGETITGLRWGALSFIIVGMGIQIFSGTRAPAPRAGHKH
jgi:multidrug transporter EmrE-like cation transporter